MPNSLLVWVCFYLTCKHLNSHKCVAEIEKSLKLDRILFPHYKFYIREMRIIIYNQLLQSYRSLTIESMARSFGVSEDWIDSYVLFF